MKRALLFVVLSAAAFAQAPSPAPPKTGSVRGTVRDESTGLPIPDIPVSVGQKTAVTDANGRYTARDLNPGLVQINIFPSPQSNRPPVNKAVNLIAGQDLVVDISVRPYGQISGRVVDQNREPLPGLTVSLVSRQYMLGSLRHTFTSIATTDDQGNYTLPRVEPDRAYLVVVYKRDIRLEPISESPENPKLRRPAWVPTFYPGATSLQGAQALSLRPGEHREHIDFQMARSPSFCIDGVVQAPAESGAVHFQIAEQQPTYGTSGNGGTYGALPNGTAGDDGKIRICNLHPGEYQLAVFSDTNDGKAFNDPAFYGTTLINILDRDLTRVFLTAQPRIPVTAEVVWAGDAPNPPPTAPLVFSVRSLTRTELLGPRIPIPGSVAIGNLALDDYSLDFFRGIPKGSYIKDITYGNASLLHEPLRPGSANGQASVKIILARNGATVSASVADKDGNPVPDTPIVIFPESPRSEAALADAMVTGRTDAAGAWTPPDALAPGKYFVIAPNLTVDKSPESVARLVRARGKAQEVDLAPGGSSQVALAIVPVD